MSLYEHKPHSYKARNVNAIHTSELALAGFNQRFAVDLTKVVGTVWCAYTFAAIAVIGLFGILGLLSPMAVILVSWASQTLIQLVLLPVIMVGQNVLSRKSELQADEQFNATIKAEHDIEQIAKHLDKQDEVILEILRRLEAGA